MKKLLLGSTALVVGGLMAAPAMAADPIKIGVGGYYQFYAQAGSISSVYALNGSSVQYKGVNFIQEGEIHFIGQTKLDNGTTIGIRVELEGWNSATSSTTTTGSVRQIDEAYLFAFGDWGRVEFGSKDQASYIMYYGTPSALLGFGFIQHNSNFTWSNGAANTFNKAWFHVTDGTIGGQFQDVNRINYYTPRFAGLQIGVGYAPKINLNQGNTGLAAGPFGPGSTCGFNDATTANNCPTADYSWQDVWDIGANYLNKFGDVTVAAYGAFMYANFVPGYQPLASAANLTTGANLAPWKQWVVGLQFGFAGFTLGGSVGYDNNGLGANYYTGVDNDTRYVSVGLMYETGPWQMSVGWVGSQNTNGNGSISIASTTVGTSGLNSNITAATTTAQAFSQNPNNGGLVFGTETSQKFEAGANYALGPGIKLTGGFVYYTSNGPTNAVVGNSWAALLGMDFRF
jgi:outer membrane protein OmpU